MQTAKIEKLDEKIKSLLQEKKNLLEKRAKDLAHLLIKSDLHLVEEEVLIGALLELKDDLTSSSDKQDKWRARGKEFFRKRKNKTVKQSSKKAA